MKNPARVLDAVFSNGRLQECLPADRTFGAEKVPSWEGGARAAAVEIKFWWGKLSLEYCTLCPSSVCLSREVGRHQREL